MSGSLRYAIRTIKARFGERPLAGAEIGVAEGLHAKDIVESLNLKKLYLVDIWGVYRVRLVGREFDVDFSAYYDKVKILFAHHGNVEIMKKASIDASLCIQDGSLDFAYIDACHDYDAVIKDLAAWLPKIKPGGILSGHDYTDMCPGTRRAVDTFFKEKNMELHLDPDNDPSRMEETFMLWDWWVAV